MKRVLFKNIEFGSLSFIITEATLKGGCDEVKQQLVAYIQLLMDNLTQIKDETGDFLLHYQDVVVDDKSWQVWNWPQGIGLYGIYKYWKLSRDEKAFEVMMTWFETQMAAGAPPKNVNTMAVLLTMAFLYEETGDSRFVPYLEQWAQWVMDEMPRTKENGLQHMTYGYEKKGQLWDDTLVMTVLPLAKIGMLFKRQDYIEEAKRQFLIHVKYLADKETGLWYHGWTFEGNHHYAKALWGRGNCWVTIAIPEIIEILELSQGDFLRDFLVETLKRQVDSLVKYQSESGLWHTLIQDNTSYLEASATAGFAYGILKSVNMGYLDRQYEEVAIKAIKGLLPEITEAGAVQKVSVGTGMGADLEYYKGINSTEMPYGQSLVILCLTEYLKTFL